MCGMIIENTKNKVQTSGNIQSASCTIDAEDMRYIASLLRNNYSDTMLATMREIIANGIDVSNGRKVDVQLPTKLEPNFIVKDYGCGLSEEDMMGLYTKYGKSTKRDSNNAIGGFGIGRFAPLSYGDSFIVMSVCDGQKTAYTIRVDENDDTVVSKMFSESTEDDNGIYVQVPIQIKDVEDFNFKFKNFSLYLADKIHLLNEEWNQELPTFSCDSFDFYERQGYGDYRDVVRKAHVLMGGILYPVVIDSQKYPSFGEGVVYKAQIGEFKLHHSRESLEYNDKTVVTLRKASEKIKKDFQKFATAKIEKAECLYDAKRVFTKEVKRMCVNIFRNAKLINCTWRDFPVNDAIFSFDDCKSVHLVTKTPTGNISTRSITSSWKFLTQPSHKRYFVIDDGVTPRSPHSRLSWVEDGQEIFLLRLKDEAMDKFNAMDTNHVSLLSSHERVISSSKSNGKKGDVKKGDILLFSQTVNYVWKDSQFWQEAKEEFSDDETYYYYVYNANKIEALSGYCQAPSSVYNRLAELRLLDPKIDKVYGVRKKALKKIEKKSNWVRMDDIENKIVNNSPILKELKKYAAMNSLVYDYNRNWITQALEKAPSNQIILKFKKLLKDVSALERPRKAPSINLDEIKIDISKEIKIKEDFLSAYPLMKHLASSYSSDELAEDVAKYLTKW